MRRTARLFITGSAAIALVLLGASPAMADAAEDGRQGCRAGEIAAMVLKGRLGDLNTKGPGDTSYTYWGYFGSWASREDTGSSGYRIGIVQGTSADIDHVVTRGYCIF